MPQTSALLDLPYIQPAQAQKHVTHNEALRTLDAIVQLNVDALDLDTPPPTAETGARFIVGPGATAAWAGQAGAIAVYEDAGWVFYPPMEGWVAYVRGAEGFARFDGTSWAMVAGDTSPAMLGINSTASAINRLTVASDATLLSHDGDDHRVTVNKAQSSDTASLLFQSGFSGRAEMGLAGDDRFSIKVSADGAAWTTALQFDPATGAVSGQAIQQAPDDVTPGRLALAQNAVLRDQIVGVTSQAGGEPTGALIERGTNAMGDYVKWADGTIICTRTVIIDLNTTADQSFDFAMPMTSVHGASVSGADVAEMDDSLRAGGADRRRAVGEMPVWADTAGWHLQLPVVVAADTVLVTLFAKGLWF